MFMTDPSLYGATFFNREFPVQQPWQTWQHRFVPPFMGYGFTPPVPQYPIYDKFQFPIYDKFPFPTYDKFPVLDKFPVYDKFPFQQFVPFQQQFLPFQQTLPQYNLPWMNFPYHYNWMKPV